MVGNNLTDFAVKQHVGIGLDTEYISRCTSSNFQYKKIGAIFSV